MNTTATFASNLSEIQDPTLGTYIPYSRRAGIPTQHDVVILRELSTRFRIQVICYPSGTLGIPLLVSKDRVSITKAKPPETAPDPVFRLFTREDYFAYSGVESANPRIASISREGSPACLDIIQDGCLIRLMVMADEECEEWDSGEYNGEATAEAVAEAMLKATLDFLKDNDDQNEYHASQILIQRFHLTQV